MMIRFFFVHFAGNIDTKSGVYPSQSSTYSSPSHNASDSSSDALDFNFIEHQTIDFSSVTQPMEKLRILAQPKALYRERYCSETDPSKNRAQRFIRADDERSRHEYPTVQVRQLSKDKHEKNLSRVFSRFL